MSQDSREQFEQAFAEDNAIPVDRVKACRQEDSYNVPRVARAWYWWKRSRAAVVVELPKAEDVGEISVVMMHHPDDVRAAIEAAGVKVAT